MFRDLSLNNIKELHEDIFVALTELIEMFDVIAMTTSVIVTSCFLIIFHEVIILIMVSILRVDEVTEEMSDRYLDGNSLTQFHENTFRRQVGTSREIV